MLDLDFTQRFLFDDTDVRGEWAGLERSYAEVLAKHPYPEPVAALLGELLAAAALLVGTLKFDGLLVLQARSAGAVPLLMVECSSAREVRGIARYHAESVLEAHEGLDHRFGGLFGLAEHHADALGAFEHLDDQGRAVDHADQVGDVIGRVGETGDRQPDALA